MAAHTFHVMAYYLFKVGISLVVWGRDDVAELVFRGSLRALLKLKDR